MIKLKREKRALEKEFLSTADKNMNKTKLKQTCKYLAQEKLSLFNKNIQIQQDALKFQKETQKKDEKILKMEKLLMEM